ncbi:MAG: type II secretion system F family protein [Acidobacteriaceae bacterium]|nr:type II secretion system F family protein [Acidobacteriaceae bacterium]
MLVLVPIVLFLIIVGVVSYFGYVHYVRPTRMLDQLANTNSQSIPRSLAGRRQKREFSVARLLEPIGNLLPLSAQDTSAAKQDLFNAGFRTNSAVGVYYGSKIALAAVLVIGALIVRDRIDNPLLRLIFPVAGGGIGYFLPAIVLGRLVKRRHEKIRFSLPDVLDLLVICTEAGCGLDQAIVNVSRELKNVHPAVAEELTLVNMEIMAGKSRSEALRNFARRTGEDEVKKLVAILIQTDRFGTSVADALRTQSDFLRIRRRQEAEERAGKVGVKLVFPIFFFCLPALLVVTAGPGMLQLFHNLPGTLQAVQQ